MRNSYDFTTGLRDDKFTFSSTGPKGEISKGVIFEMEDDGLYSVIMGDLDENGELKPLQPTGNGDAKKVLATVADIIEYFVERKPKAVIFMTGITDQLTSIYKQLLLHELNLPSYDMEGLNADNTSEPIDPNKDYEGFFVFRK